jgi:hypothetical protein
MWKTVPLLVALAACGTNSPTVSSNPDLSSKYQAYKSMYTPTQFGCDSTLFSGLVGSVPGITVDLPAARKDGVWTRNPDIDCYTEGLSKSSFSRDMFVGVLWWSVANKRLDVLEDVYQYCEQQTQFPLGGCFIGQGSVSDPRHWMSPNLVDTLAESIVYLGGENHFVARGLYSGESDVDGFQAHLSVLHVLLRGKIQNSLSDRQLRILKSQAERQPQNALFQAAYHKYSDGDQSAAIQILMNPALFPNDSLPSTSNYCTEWLWQRDFSNEKDWTPCPEQAKLHSGGDFLFAAALILGDI